MKRAVSILKDVCALALAGALAIGPVAAVHMSAGNVAEAAQTEASPTPLAQTGGVQENHPLAATNASSDANGSDVQTNINAQDLSSFYLTNAGLVSTVKLQNPWGACWAFAIASAVESSILHAEAARDGSLEAREESAMNTSPKFSGLDNSVDVSERAIAWLAHELQTDESAGNQAGEGLYRVNINDFTTQLSGGNFSIVETALAADQNLVSVDTVPYSYNGYTEGELPWFSTPPYGPDARARDWSIDDSYRTTNDLGWYVDEIVKLPSPAVIEYVPTYGAFEYQGYDADGTKAIKQALVDIGAVAISLEAETSLPGEARSSDHFDYSSWAQYNSSEDVLTNHAVSIVGWDDSFSASNFSGTQSGRPPADGAWLCKNNWGSDTLYNQLGGAAYNPHWGIQDENGASGFFWLSYYDHTVTMPTAFKVKSAEERPDTLYQYDYVSGAEFSEPARYRDVVRVANVFTAEETQLLREVSAMTFSENDTAYCWIYWLPPEEGETENASSTSEEPSPDSPAANVINEDINLLDQSIQEDVLSAEDAEKLRDYAAEAQSIMLGETVMINDEDFGPLGNGTLAATAQETFEYAGFHTIELDAPVLVSKGQRFAVVERIQTTALENGQYVDSSYLNLELAFNDPPDDGLPVETMAKVVSNPGETYVSLERESWMPVEDFNSWYSELMNGAPDVTFGNALIKAQGTNTSMAGEDRVYELVSLK